MNKKVRIYTTSECVYCSMLKNYLAEKKVEFVSVDVGKDRKAFVEMKEKTGLMSVPVIDIEGKIISGFDKEAIAKELGL
jgi:glutaredoxin 3